MLECLREKCEPVYTMCVCVCMVVYFSVHVYIIHMWVLIREFLVFVGVLYVCGCLLGCGTLCVWLYVGLCWSTCLREKYEPVYSICMIVHVC